MEYGGIFHVEIINVINQVDLWTYTTSFIRDKYKYRICTALMRLEMQCLLSAEYFQTEPTEDLTSVILYCPSAEQHCVWE